MGQQELFTLAVAIAGVMIVGRAVARRLEVPDAIVLVVLGVLTGLIPQVPNVDLPPDVVLLLFLPPLVYNAAFLSAPRETRENAIPITGLAFGATAATASVGATAAANASAGAQPRPGRTRRVTQPTPMIVAAVAPNASPVIGIAFSRLSRGADRNAAL